VRARQLCDLIDEDDELGLRMQNDLRYIWAEVLFAVRNDLAKTLEDVLARRIPLLLVGRKQGLDVVDRVADMMTAELGWSSERRAEEIERYRRVVADSHRF